MTALTDGGRPLDLHIENHRVVGVPYVQDNMGPEITPAILVLHYTATREGQATVKSLEHPGQTASVHLVLHPDGSWTQMVPFNRRAGHAGRSEWKGRTACNNFSLGIEIVNPGPLERDGRTLVIDRSPNGELYRWAKPWTGGVVHARHKNGLCPYKLWCAYTDEQMVALAPMARLLVEEYRLLEIVGHDDVAPSRKIDPGPAFPWDEFRLAVFGPGPAYDDVTETIPPVANNT